MKILNIFFWLSLCLQYQAGYGQSKINPTKAFTSHKGFMVFLNWHYLQSTPEIVKSHFKKVKQAGPWKEYEGSYGGFHTVKVGICQGKLTQIFAVSRPLPGGVQSFLTTWLEQRILAEVQMVRDSMADSRFLISSIAANRTCARIAGRKTESLKNNPTL